MVRRLLCCLLAAAPIAIAPAGSRAEPAASKADIQAAKAYAEAGVTAQNSGDYDTAITLYEKAYELVPRPVLVFDMAQAHRLAGRAEKALKLYRRFLKEAPRDPQASLARELVAELEAANDHRQGADDSDESSRHDSRRTDRSDGARGARRGKQARSVADRGEPGADSHATAPFDDAADRDRHEEVAPPWPLARFDIGPSFTDRRLSYDTRSGFAEAPPGVTTSAPGVRIEGEVYPIALIDPDSTLAGLGIALAYDKTLGLGLQPMDQLRTAPVDQSHGRIGARLRVGLGKTGSYLVGIDYARRQFLVDQSKLTGVIDVPDIDYTSIDPVIGAEVSVADGAAVFGALDAMLIRDAGAITDSTRFGHSTMYGLEATGGIEVSLPRQVRLRLTIEYLRIAMSFDTTNAQTAGRDSDTSTKDINGAMERSFGVVATIGMAY